MIIIMIYTLCCCRGFHVKDPASCHKRSILLLQCVSVIQVQTESGVKISGSCCSSKYIDCLYMTRPPKIIMHVTMPTNIVIIVVDLIVNLFLSCCDNNTPLIYIMEPFRNVFFLSFLCNAILSKELL